MHDTLSLWVDRHLAAGLLPAEIFAYWPHMYSHLFNCRAGSNKRAGLKWATQFLDFPSHKAWIFVGFCFSNPRLPKYIIKSQKIGEKWIKRDKMFQCSSILTSKFISVHTRLLDRWEYLGMYVYTLYLCAGKNKAGTYLDKLPRFKMDE